MPELPEVETVVRGLRPALEGRRVVAVTLRRPDLRRPIPADLAPRLTGATVTAVERRAKYGLIHTDAQDTMLFHLGMSGRMRLDPADPSPHDHVEWRTDAGTRVVLTDPRRFGLLDLAPTADLPRHPLLAHLGPEPLSSALTGPALARAFRDRIAPVKALLLDQQIVAGVGNIYASETLHRARLHPDRAAGSLSAAETARLVRALKAVLTQAIAAGGSSLRDHVGVDGVLGYFQASFRVYGRAGEPCPACRAPVERLTHSNRSTFLCPVCQPR